MRQFLIIFVILGFSLSGFSQITMKAKDAHKHIGDSVTVIEKVHSTKVLENGTTLFYLGGTYPNHSLTITIPRESEDQGISKKYQQLQGRQVLVSGKVVNSKGKPGIVVKHHAQIEELRESDSRLDLKGIQKTQE